MVTRIAQQIGGSFGTAVLAVILSGAVARHGDLTAGFSVAFWWATGFSALAVLLSLWLPGGSHRTWRFLPHSVHLAVLGWRDDIRRRRGPARGRRRAVPAGRRGGVSALPWLRVTAAENGTDALRLARGQRFDLVILDVMLPDLDGFEIVRRLRRDGNRVPIIFLTAKDAKDNKVTGLTIGGDDYMTKPFGLEELAARVRTVLRRTRPAPVGAVLEFADLTLDQDTYEVRRGGRLIELSPTEFRLLRYFMLYPGRVLAGSSSSSTCGITTLAARARWCPLTWPTCGASSRSQVRT